MLLFVRREEFGEEWITPLRCFESGAAVSREVIVLPGWPKLFVGDGLLLPLGAYEAVTLESTQSRIDGAAGQAGLFHDAEAIDGSSVDCVEDHRGRMGEFCLGGHARNFTYVADYLTSERVVCYIGWQENTHARSSEPFEAVSRHSGGEWC